MLRIFLIFLAAVILPNPALAQNGCNAASDIPVNVTPVFDNPKYDFTASIPDIQRIVADTEHSIHESLSLGVTHYESMLEFRTPVVTVTFPNGAACTSVQRADVTVGYKDVTVYIAREIPQNSCGFNEVMAHEQKHIAVNRRVLQEYVPRIRERLEIYLKSNGVFRGQDRDKEVALVRQNLQAILNEVGQEMMNDNIARQRDVDSPEEYKRLSDVCNGQLAVIAGRSLGARR